MKPIDVENEILLAIRRAGNGKTLTIAHIHRRLCTASGEGVSWRMVANACTRLERMGLTSIEGEEKVGDTWHPAYALTEAGKHAAHTARIQRHNAARAAQRQEDSDANA